MTQWHAEDGFWITFRPIFFHDASIEAAPQDVTGFERLAGVVAGTTVLDMACGIGRHSLELARRGFRVTSVDRTATYLHELGDAARDQGLTLDIVRRDVRDFRRRGAFDAALCLGDSIGYFEDPADELLAARNLCDSLVSGGALVVDTTGREVVARGWQAQRWQWLDSDQLFLEQRTVSEDWTWTGLEWTIVAFGDQKTWTMWQRLYSGAELKALLEEAGFSSVRLFGGLDGRPYDLDAEKLVAVAEK